MAIENCERCADWWRLGLSDTCPNCDQIELERMTEGEMIIQGLREAVDWSRETKPHTQETGETDG